MKVKYDKETDVLYIQFSDEIIKESDEDKPGVILDYSENGSIIGIEILDASVKMPNPTSFQFEMV